MILHVRTNPLCYMQISPLAHVRMIPCHERTRTYSCNSSTNVRCLSFMCVPMCVCTNSARAFHSCAYVCMYMCNKSTSARMSFIHVCMYVCMYVYTFMQLIHKRKESFIHLCMYVCIYIHVLILKRKVSFIHVCMYIYIFMQLIHKRKVSFIHLCMYVCIYIHATHSQTQSVFHTMLMMMIKCAHMQHSQAHTYQKLAALHRHHP
jgi:hypothetical protein